MKTVLLALGLAVAGLLPASDVFASELQCPAGQKYLEFRVTADGGNYVASIESSLEGQDGTLVLE